MPRRILFMLLVGFAAVLPVSAYGQTVDEVIAKHVQARGGLDKLKAAKTIRMTGKMTVGPGLEAPVVVEQKRPNHIRIEFTIQGMTGIMAFDGKGGWTLIPFSGKKDPEAMGEDDLKEAEEQADLDGPFIDYKEKGNKVELVGKESVEGTDAYKLKATLKDGTVQYSYVDADSYLVIKEESKRTIRGVERETEATLGDYKKVEGLMFPCSIETGAKGDSQKQKITIEKIEINPAIDDSRFKMPEAKK
ncbi:MAG TPA: outer membrane lipoprotein-sorting protein [Blastocatellia bacterium]|nr:outer membrane lipoprotein-sorting protein [Blastocatellia bacterium]